MDLSARNVFLVSYDVSDPKRLTKVRKTVLGFGEPVQLSVFLCELSAREKIELKAALFEVIDTKADQVLFVNLGPIEGRGSEVIETLGRAHAEIDRHAVVI